MSSEFSAERSLDTHFTAFISLYSLHIPVQLSYPFTANLFSKHQFLFEETGDFQNYRNRTVGKLKLEAGNFILQVRPLRIAKNAAMDLKQVTLTPVKTD